MSKERSENMINPQDLLLAGNYLNHTVKITRDDILRIFLDKFIEARVEYLHVELTKNSNDILFNYKKARPLFEYRGALKQYENVVDHFKTVDFLRHNFGELYDSMSRRSKSIENLDRIKEAVETTDIENSRAVKLVGDDKKKLTEVSKILEKIGKANDAFQFIKILDEHVVDNIYEQTGDKPRAWATTISKVIWGIFAEGGFVTVGFMVGGGGLSGGAGGVAGLALFQVMDEGLKDSRVIEDMIHGLLSPFMDDAPENEMELVNFQISDSRKKMLRAEKGILENDQDMKEYVTQRKIDIENGDFVRFPFDIAMNSAAQMRIAHAEELEKQTKRLKMAEERKNMILRFGVRKIDSQIQDKRDSLNYLGKPRLGRMQPNTMRGINSQSVEKRLIEEEIEKLEGAKEAILKEKEKLEKGGGQNMSLQNLGLSEINNSIKTVSMPVNMSDPSVVHPGNLLAPYRNSTLGFSGVDDSIGVIKNKNRASSRSPAASVVNNYYNAYQGGGASSVGIDTVHSASA